ncbi:hypothetical protein ACFQ4J_05245 [Laceyella tengchongensis]|jgi:hypothetical protein
MDSTALLSGICQRYSESSNQDTEKRENSRKSDLIDDMFAFIGVRSEELDDAPLAVKVMDEAAQACHRH